MAIVGLEGIALAVAAIYFLVELLVEQPTSAANAIALVIVLAIGAMVAADDARKPRRSIPFGSKVIGLT